MLSGSLRDAGGGGGVCAWFLLGKQTTVLLSWENVGRVDASRGKVILNLL